MLLPEHRLEQDNRVRQCLAGQWSELCLLSPAFFGMRRRVAPSTQVVQFLMSVAIDALGLCQHPDLFVQPIGPLAPVIRPQQIATETCESTCLDEGMLGELVTTTLGFAVQLANSRANALCKLEIVHVVTEGTARAPQAKFNLLDVELNNYGTLSGHE